MNRTTATMLYLFILWILIGASGCNTIEGAGKDIEKAGEAIQEGAD